MSFFRSFTGRTTRPLNPGPMPQVRCALMSVRDLQEAAGRAAQAWNPTQLRDALRSVRYFLEAAEASLEKEAAAMHREPDNTGAMGREASA